MRTILQGTWARQEEETSHDLQTSTRQKTTVFLMIININLCLIIDKSINSEPKKKSL